MSFFFFKFGLYRWLAVTVAISFFRIWNIIVFIIVFILCVYETFYTKKTIHLISNNFNEEPTEKGCLAFFFGKGHITFFLDFKMDVRFHPKALSM